MSWPNIMSCKSTRYLQEYCDFSIYLIKTLSGAHNTQKRIAGRLRTFRVPCWEILNKLCFRKAPLIRYRGSSKAQFSITIPMFISELLANKVFSALAGRAPIKNSAGLTVWNIIISSLDPGVKGLLQRTGFSVHGTWLLWVRVLTPIPYHICR